MPRRPKLVTQYLENISREALEEHPQLVQQFVGRRNGIYALFNRGTLHYAGLASDLRWRLKHHLKDRLRDEWDSFSVYLTIGDKHLRELESLLIRVTRPPGNRQLGKLAGAENLDRKFGRALDHEHAMHRNRLMGRPVPSDNERAQLRTVKLRGHYKGKSVQARYRPDGSIRWNKKTYSSLSAAASAVCGHSVNGRRFWCFERSPGDWVRMLEYRKKPTPIHHRDAQSSARPPSALTAPGASRGRRQ